MVCIVCKEQKDYRRKDGLCDVCRAGVSIQLRIDFAKRICKRFKALVEEMESQGQISPGSIKIELSI